MCVCIVIRWTHPLNTHPSTKPTPPTAGAAPPLAATTAAELFHFCRVHPQLVLVAYHGG